jgi:hypothetical protein
VVTAVRREDVCDRVVVRPAIVPVEPRHLDFNEPLAWLAEEARVFGAQIGIDWASAPFDVDQFRIGTNVELEHGLHDPLTNGRLRVSEMAGGLAQSFEDFLVVVPTCRPRMLQREVALRDDVEEWTTKEGARLRG